MISPCLDLNIRSYSAEHAAHSHAFDQLVLPLDGELLIEVGGQEERLMPGRVAVVASGECHTQMARAVNHSLILDLAPQALSGEAERLLQHPFLAISPAATKLIDFMGLTLTEPPLSPTILAQWTSLLLDALGRPATPPSRLATLLAAIEGAPGEAWTTPRMAALAALSTSRLHAVFREELQSTPMAWVTAQRMRLARELLQHTRLAIGEIAWRCGYADQGAFARAFNRACGVSPAATRQQQCSS
jgi:AraC-like DNA-binding protein